MDEFILDLLFLSKPKSPPPSAVPDKSMDYSKASAVASYIGGDQFMMFCLLIAAIVIAGFIFRNVLTRMGENNIYETYPYRNPVTQPQDDISNPAFHTRSSEYTFPCSPKSSGGLLLDRCLLTPPAAHSTLSSTWGVSETPRGDVPHVQHVPFTRDSSSMAISARNETAITTTIRTVTDEELTSTSTREHTSIGSDEVVQECDPKEGCRISYPRKRKRLQRSNRTKTSPPRIERTGSTLDRLLVRNGTKDQAFPSKGESYTDDIKRNFTDDQFSLHDHEDYTRSIKKNSTTENKEKMSYPTLNGYQNETIGSSHQEKLHKDQKPRSRIQIDQFGDVMCLEAKGCAIPSDSKTRNPYTKTSNSESDEDPGQTKKVDRHPYGSKQKVAPLYISAGRIAVQESSRDSASKDDSRKFGGARCFESNVSLTENTVLISNKKGSHVLKTSLFQCQGKFIAGEIHDNKKRESEENKDFVSSCSLVERIENCRIRNQERAREIETTIRSLDTDDASPTSKGHISSSSTTTNSEIKKVPFCFPFLKSCITKPGVKKDSRKTMEKRSENTLEWDKPESFDIGDPKYFRNVSTKADETTDGGKASVLDRKNAARHEQSVIDLHKAQQKMANVIETPTKRVGAFAGEAGEALPNERGSMKQHAGDGLFTRHGDFPTESQNSVGDKTSTSMNEFGKGSSHDWTSNRKREDYSNLHANRSSDLVRFSKQRASGIRTSTRNEESAQYRQTGENLKDFTKHNLKSPSRLSKSRCRVIKKNIIRQAMPPKRQILDARKDLWEVPNHQQSGLRLSQLPRFKFNNENLQYLDSLSESNPKYHVASHPEKEQDSIELSITDGKVNMFRCLTPQWSAPSSEGNQYDAKKMNDVLVEERVEQLRQSCPRDKKVQHRRERLESKHEEVLKPRSTIAKNVSNGRMKLGVKGEVDKRNKYHNDYSENFGQGYFGKTIEHYGRSKEIKNDTQDITNVAHYESNDFANTENLVSRGYKVNDQLGNKKRYEENRKKTHREKIEKRSYFGIKHGESKLNFGKLEQKEYFENKNKEENDDEMQVEKDDGTQTDRIHEPRFDTGKRVKAHLATRDLSKDCLEGRRLRNKHSDIGVSEKEQKNAEQFDQELYQREHCSYKSQSGKLNGTKCINGYSKTGLRKNEKNEIGPDDTNHPARNGRLASYSKKLSAPDTNSPPRGNIKNIVDSDSSPQVLIYSQTKQNSKRCLQLKCLPGKDASKKLSGPRDLVLNQTLSSSSESGQRPVPLKTYDEFTTTQMGNSNQDIYHKRKSEWLENQDDRNLLNSTKQKRLSGDYYPGLSKAAHLRVSSNSVFRREDGDDDDNTADMKCHVADNDKQEGNNERLCSNDDNFLGGAGRLVSGPSDSSPGSPSALPFINSLTKLKTQYTKTTTSKYRNDQSSVVHKTDSCTKKAELPRKAEVILYPKETKSGDNKAAKRIESIKHKIGTCPKNGMDRERELTNYSSMKVNSTAHKLASNEAKNTQGAKPESKPSPQNRLSKIRNLRYKLQRAPLAKVQSNTDTKTISPASELVSNPDFRANKTSMEREHQKFNGGMSRIPNKSDITKISPSDIGDQKTPNLNMRLPRHIRNKSLKRAARPQIQLSQNKLVAEKYACVGGKKDRKEDKELNGAIESYTNMYKTLYKLRNNPDSSPSVNVVKQKSRTRSSNTKLAARKITPKPSSSQCQKESTPLIVRKVRSPTAGKQVNTIKEGLSNGPSKPVLKNTEVAIGSTWNRKGSKITKGSSYLQAFRESAKIRPSSLQISSQSFETHSQSKSPKASVDNDAGNAWLSAPLDQRNLKNQENGSRVAAINNGSNDYGPGNGPFGQGTPENCGVSPDQYQWNEDSVHPQELGQLDSYDMPRGISSVLGNLACIEDLDAVEEEKLSLPHHLPDLIMTSSGDSSSGHNNRRDRSTGRFTRTATASNETCNHAFKGHDDESRPNDNDNSNEDHNGHIQLSFSPSIHTQRSQDSIASTNNYDIQNFTITAGNIVGGGFNTTGTGRVFSTRRLSSRTKIVEGYVQSSNCDGLDDDRNVESIPSGSKSKCHVLRKLSPPSRMKPSSDYSPDSDYVERRHLKQKCPSDVFTTPNFKDVFKSTDTLQKWKKGIIWTAKSNPISDANRDISFTVSENKKDKDDDKKSYSRYLTHDIIQTNLLDKSVSMPKTDNKVKELGEKEVLRTASNGNPKIGLSLSRSDSVADRSRNEPTFTPFENGEPKHRSDNIHRSISNSSRSRRRNWKTTCPKTQDSRENVEKNKSEKSLMHSCSDIVISWMSEEKKGSSVFITQSKDTTDLPVAFDTQTERSQKELLLSSTENTAADVVDRDTCTEKTVSSFREYLRKSGKETGQNNTQRKTEGENIFLKMARVKCPPRKNHPTLSVRRELKENHIFKCEERSKVIPSVTVRGSAFYVKSATSYYKKKNMTGNKSSFGTHSQCYSGDETSGRDNTHQLSNQEIAHPGSLSTEAAVVSMQSANGMTKNNNKIRNTFTSLYTTLIDAVVHEEDSQQITTRSQDPGDIIVPVFLSENEDNWDDTSNDVLTEEMYSGDSSSWGACASHDKMTTATAATPEFSTERTDETEANSPEEGTSTNEQDGNIQDPRPCFLLDWYRPTLQANTELETHVDTEAESHDRVVNEGDHAYTDGDGNKDDGSDYDDEENSDVHVDANMDDNITNDDEDHSLYESVSDEYNTDYVASNSLSSTKDDTYAFNVQNSQGEDQDGYITPSIAQREDSTSSPTCSRNQGNTLSRNTDPSFRSTFTWCNRHRTLNHTLSNNTRVTLFGQRVGANRADASTSECQTVAREDRCQCFQRQNNMFPVLRNNIESDGVVCNYLGKQGHTEKKLSSDLPSLSVTSSTSIDAFSTVCHHCPSDSGTDMGFGESTKQENVTKIHEQAKTTKLKSSYSRIQSPKTGGQGFRQNTSSYNLRLKSEISSNTWSFSAEGTSLQNDRCRYIGEKEAFCTCQASRSASCDTLSTGSGSSLFASCSQYGVKKPLLRRVASFEVGSSSDKSSRLTRSRNVLMRLKRSRTMCSVAYDCRRTRASTRLAKQEHRRYTKV